VDPCARLAGNLAQPIDDLGLEGRRHLTRCGQVEGAGNPEFGKYGEISIRRNLSDSIEYAVDASCRILACVGGQLQ